MISQYFMRRLQPCRDWSTSGKDFGSTSLMNLKLDKLSLDHPAISPIPLPSFAAPKRIGLKSYLRLSELGIKSALITSRLTSQRTFGWPEKPVERLNLR
jgi:hypothetical protein